MKKTEPKHGDLVNVRSPDNGRKLRGVIVKVGRIRKAFGLPCYNVNVTLGKGKSLIGYYRQSDFITNPKQLKPVSEVGPWACQFCDQDDCTGGSICKGHSNAEP